MRVRPGLRFSVRAWSAAALALLLSSALAPRVRAADEQYSEDAVKAAYLYRFAAYVEWPEQSGAGHPFIIATFGAPEIARQLRRLLPGHPIQGRVAQVREVTRAQELGDAQVLYVGSGHSEFLGALAAGANRAVLKVTADERGLDMGSVLNFVTVDKRVRFEISLTAAERAGLKISSELLSVAIRVHGGRRQSDFLCLPFSPGDETDSPCAPRQARLNAPARPGQAKVIPVHHCTKPVDPADLERFIAS
jgi:YfiR/HmsC-like